MEKELENFLNEKKISNFKYIYSQKNKILFILYKNNNNINLISFSQDNNSLQINLNENNEINNINNNLENIILELNENNNEKELIIIIDKFLFLFQNLKNINQIQKFKLSEKIISIHFSNFQKYFGILYINKFILYNFNFKIISNIPLIESQKIIDFSFNKKIQKCFEIFTIFFLNIYGEIMICGPIIPEYFFIKKLDFYKIENFLNKNLPYINKNKEIYFTYNIFNELKSSCKDINKENDNENYYFKINEKLERLNKSVTKKNLYIQNNFIKDNNNDLYKREYKQIKILNCEPIIILRISKFNEIDVIIIVENIYAMIKVINMNINKDNIIFQKNFFIERINLSNDNNNNNYINYNNYDNNLIRFYNMNNNNNKLICSLCNNNIYYIDINYLDEFEKLINLEGNEINKDNNYSIHSNLIQIISNKNNIFQKEIIIFPYEKFLILNGYIQSNNNNIKKYKSSKINYYNIIEQNKLFKLNLLNKQNFLKNSQFLLDESLEKIEKNLKDNNNNNILINNKLENLELTINEEQFEKLGLNAEKILENKIEEINLYNKNIITNNYEIFLKKLDYLIQFYKILNQNNLKEKYENIIKIYDEIKIKKEKIEENNKKIKEKIEKIEKKLDSIETDNCIKYINILNNFLEKNNNELKRLNLSFEKIKEQIKIFKKYKSESMFSGNYFDNNNVSDNLLNNIITFLERNNNICENINDEKNELEN